MSNHAGRHARRLHAFCALTLTMLASSTLAAQPAQTGVAAAESPPVLAPGSEDLTMGELDEHQVDDEADRPDYHRRSPGMIAAGIVLTALGGVNAIAGVTMYNHADETAAESGHCQQPGAMNPSGAADCRAGFADDLRTAGEAMVIGGAVAAAVGVPLLIVGAQKVKAGDDASVARKLVPTLEVRPTAASLTWQW